MLKSLRAWLVQVQALFADCGEINAITIPVDKYTGRAKGFAYLEFADKVGPCSLPDPPGSYQLDFGFLNSHGCDLTRSK